MLEEEASFRRNDDDEGEPKMSMSLSSLEEGARDVGGTVISAFSGTGQSGGGDDGWIILGMLQGRRGSFSIWVARGNKRLSLVDCR